MTHLIFISVLFPSQREILLGSGDLKLRFQRLVRMIEDIEDIEDKNRR